MTRAAALLVAVALATPACKTLGGGGPDDATKALQDAVQAYNDAYRWKNYERAALYLPPDLRGAFLAAYEEDDKSLHVEGYQILQVQRPSEDAANVVVRTRFMLLPSVTLETKSSTQRWHRVSDRWILESEDDPIRAIDPSKLPKNPDAFGGGAPEPAEDMKVEVTDPSGKVVRKDGDVTEPDAEATPEGTADGAPGGTPK